MPKWSVSMTTHRHPGQARANAATAGKVRVRGGRGEGVAARACGEPARAFAIGTALPHRLGGPPETIDTSYVPPDGLALGHDARAQHGREQQARAQGLGNEPAR